MHRRIASPSLTNWHCAYTYVAYDRASQGQTFTSGSSPTGYDITSIRVQHVGYSSNSMNTGGCSNGTWLSIPAGATFTLRITDPSKAGTDQFAIASETFTFTGKEGWPAEATSDRNGDGLWLPLELSKPVTLNGNTRYGFDLTARQPAYFEWLGSRNGTLAGGAAYYGGTTGQNGGPDNVMKPLARDRVFLVEMKPH